MNSRAVQLSLLSMALLVLHERERTSLACCDAAPVRTAHLISVILQHRLLNLWLQSAALRAQIANVLLFMYFELRAQRASTYVTASRRASDSTTPLYPPEPPPSFHPYQLPVHGHCPGRPTSLMIDSMHATRLT